MRLVEKLKRKLKREDYQINTDGDLYKLLYEDFTIYSHNKECIERAFTQIFKNAFYDFDVEDSSPLILDVGANIGMAVLYWKKKYPEARIIAFEPDKKAFKSLLKNVEANNLTNVKCLNKAISDKEGYAEFNTNEIISGSIIREKNLRTKYSVETTTLKKFLEEKIDFLKVDIEGSEKFIFNDLKDSIGNIKFLFLEYHSFIHENQYLAKFLDLFERNGFRYIIEDEFKRKGHFVKMKNSLNQDMQLNIWARKNIS